MIGGDNMGRNMEKKQVCRWAISIALAISMAMPIFTIFNTLDVGADEVLCDIIGATRATSLGYDGTGVLIGEAGTGLDTGRNSTLFTDLAGRMDYWVDWTETNTADGVAEDTYGLSTPIISWMAGDASSSQFDPVDGKLYGSGVAPNARLMNERVFGDAGGWFAGDVADVFQDAAVKGAYSLTNSWGGGTIDQYETNCNKVDTAVRDADPDTPGEQPLFICMAAGSTVDLLGSACNKNGMTVGMSEGYKPHKSTTADNINELYATSPIGPTADGRIKPDLVAPATWGPGVKSHVSTYTGNQQINTDYIYFSGTGGSAALGTGASAVFAQYYEDMNGAIPSPAMTKAALINGATDMDDAYNTGPIPNNQEGWGRLNLTNVIEPGFNVFYEDQSAPLQDGVNKTYPDVFVTDNSKPLKISLVWTDVPAPATTGAGRALINDLYLRAVSPTGVIYSGNMFLNGWSQAGVMANDALNNVECIYVQTPELGKWAVTVNGYDIVQDGVPGTVPVDQDFALVISGKIKVGGGPVVTNAFADPNPTNGTGTTTLYAVLSDSNNITGAEYFIGAGGANGTGISMSSLDLGFDSTGETAYSAINVLALGWLPGEVHSVFVHAVDETGDWGLFREVPIYVGTGYYLHVENSVGAGMSLWTAVPDESVIITNTTGNIPTPGQYRVGNQAWLTNTFTADTQVGGTWRYFINGYSTTFETAGNLYAKIYKHSTMTLLNPIPIRCPTNVSGKLSYSEFEWSETLASTVISAGDRIYMEIWLDCPTGGGSSGITVYNYASIQEAAGPHYGYFIDVNDIVAPTGPSQNSNTPFTTTMYTQVTGSDDVRAISVDPQTQDEIFIWSSFQITEVPSSITQIEFTFEGQGDAATNFQIWVKDKYNAWAQLGTAMSAAADTDIVMVRSITANCANYLTTGRLVWGIYQTDDSDLVRVDNIQMRVTYFQPAPQFIMGYDFGSTSSMIVIPEAGAGPAPTWDLDLTGHAVGEWVLVSFPIMVSGNPVTILNDSIYGDSGTEWDRMYAWNSVNQRWLKYSKFMPSASTLTNIDNTMGIWIHLSSNGGDQMLTMGPATYPTVPTNITLNAGWNLIGYPSLTPRSALSLMPPAVDRMAIYSPISPYITDTTDISSVTMSPGNGYWVHATVTASVTINP